MNSTNYANLVLAGYLKERFPGLVCEVPIVPKKERKSKKGEKPAVSSCNINPPKNKLGWSGTCGGPTLETMVAAPGLACAYLRQRAILNVPKGPIPENILEEETSRWNEFIGTKETGNAEFWAACERMILAMAKKKPPAQDLVQIGTGETAITVRITARKDRDATLEKLVLLYLREGIEVFVQNAKGKMVPVEIEDVVPEEPEESEENVA